MPLGGESVGSAYVRIYADASDVPDGIKKGMEDAEPVIEQHGARSAKRYREAFDKELEKQRPKFQKAFRESLQAGAGDLDARARIISSGFFDSFQKDLRQRFSSRTGDPVLADQMWRNLVGDYQRGHPLERLIDQVENDLPRLVERATRDIQRIESDAAEERRKRWQKTLDEAYFMHSEFTKKRTKQERDFLAEHKALMVESDQALRESEKVRRDIIQRTTEDYNRMWREAHYENRQWDLRRRHSLAELRIEYGDLLEQMQEVDRHEKGSIRTHRRLAESLEDLRRRMAMVPGGPDRQFSHDIDLLGRRVDRAHPRVNRFNRVLDRTADLIGRSTGRGSRNDFLNFIGSMTRNVARFLFFAPKFIATVGTEMADAFKEAGGGAAGFVAAIRTLGPRLASVATTIPIVAAALVVLFAVMGPFASLLSGLVGIVSALAGSLSFALLGGIVGVIGALAPLAAGIGVTILALTNLTDEMKDRLRKQVKPLTDEFKELGQAAAGALTRDVAEQAKGLTSVLESARPLVVRIAAAVRNMASEWIEMMQGPGFRDWMKSMETFMPRAIRTLGRIAANTTAALGGMFEAAIPFIEDFLGWLERVTEKWSEWANSIEGQQQFADFLDDAAESAKSVRNFLGAIVGFLAEIFDSGREAGDNIFDKMAGAFEGWTEHLEKNPDILEDWYEHAENLADSIGDAVVAIGEFFDELDDAENRRAINDILDLVDHFATLLGILESMNTLGNPLQLMIGPVGTLVRLFERLTGLDVTGWFEDLVGFDLGTLWDAFQFDLEGWLEPFRNLGGRIALMIGRIDWGQMLHGLAAIPAQVLAYFTGLGARIIRRVGSIDWGRLARGIAAVPVAIVAEFTGLAGRIINRVGTPDWTRLLVGIARIPIRIVNQFSSTARDIINRITPVSWGDLLNGIGGVVDDLVAAFRGIAGRIVDAIGTIRPRFSLPSLGDLIPGRSASGGIYGSGSEGGGGGGGGSYAEGGLLHSARYILAGEAGPEAIVPLNRPLDQVDPSVRALSAIAQGLVTNTGERVISSGKTIDASNWTIVTPSSDARAVANETLNYLVATTYV